MYKFISIVALAATAMALPADTTVVEARSDILNPNEAFCANAGLFYGSFQCCVTRVLGGVVSIDCEPPQVSHIPDWCVTAEDVCKGTIGGKPQCCTLPVAGLGLVCQDVHS